MKTSKWLGFAAVVLLSSAAPALAHHSLGKEYDSDKPITLKGTLTSVEWRNPHVRLHLDGTDGVAQGSMDWELELASPSLLALKGVKISSLRRGDHVTINAYPARDGSSLAYATKIKRDSH